MAVKQYAIILLVGLLFALNGQMAFSADSSSILNVPLTQETTATLPNQQARGISIDATVNLPQENSLVRVVVTDNIGTDHLVSESYPLISGTGTITLSGACEETCSLSFTPRELKIQIEDASITITKITVLPVTLATNDQGVQAMYAESRIRVSKVDKINQRLQEQGAGWVAGETEISQLSYEEKKRLFRGPDGTIPETLPNLGGFEYYVGGVFSMPGETAPSTAEPNVPSTSELPAEWDWRNVHGENWMTSTKNQGSAGTCWAHANAGALEAQINLYYNQHIDPDLSEQMSVDCSNKGPSDSAISEELFDKSYTQCWVGTPGEPNPLECYPGYTYCYQMVRGIVEESCDPYVQRDTTWDPSACSEQNICSDYKDRRWMVSDFHDYKFDSDRGTPDCEKMTMDITEEELKRVLIEKGPMDSGINSWNHAMVLVGYGGNSDWKSSEYCGYEKMCVPGEGCIPQACDSPGEMKTACINSHAGYASYGITGQSGTDVAYTTVATYNCTAIDPRYGYEYGAPLWLTVDYSSCNSGEVCIDNECRPAAEYVPGTESECSTPSYGIARESITYAPGEGEEYWIYKNSWGPNWGENGYGKIAVPLVDMGWASLPIGPFTPPTGKAYEIACLDRDNDNYCTWGTTPNKPASCPASCEAEKDCDDTNQLLGPFDENLHCEKIVGRIPVQQTTNGKEITLTYSGEEPYIVRIGPTKGGVGGYVVAKTQERQFSIDLSFAKNPEGTFYYSVIDSEGNRGEGQVTIE